MLQLTLQQRARDHSGRTYPSPSSSLVSLRTRTTASPCVRPRAMCFPMSQCSASRSTSPDFPFLTRRLAADFRDSPGRIALMIRLFLDIVDLYSNYHSDIPVTEQVAPSTPEAAAVFRWTPRRFDRNLRRNAPAFP